MSLRCVSIQGTRSAAVYPCTVITHTLWALSSLFSLRCAQRSFVKWHQTQFCHHEKDLGLELFCLPSSCHLQELHYALSELDCGCFGRWSCDFETKIKECYILNTILGQAPFLVSDPFDHCIATYYNPGNCFTSCWNLLRNIGLAYKSVILVVVTKGKLEG